MTTPIDEQIEGSATETSDDWPDLGRRPLLKALSVGAVLSAGAGVASARDEEHTDDENDDEGQNQAEGFNAEVVAPRAAFPDDVGAAFGVDYRDGPEGAAFLHDASNVVIVKVTLEPGGTSGWHTDNGPAVAVVVQGEVDVTFEDDDECFTHTYEAGEAAIATGNRADLVENASDSEGALAYVIFFGVPDGEPPSSPVEAPDC